MDSAELPKRSTSIEEGEEVSDEWHALARSLELGTMREPVYGSIRLNANARTVMCESSGKSARLTKSEFLLLWAMVRAQGNPVKRVNLEELLYRDLPPEKDRPLGNTVEVFIARIRRKLESIDASVYIPDERVGGSYGHLVHRLAVR